MNRPFINTRIRVTDSTFSVDFYDRVDTQSYVKSFNQAWRDAERQARIKGSLIPTSIPFYFTSCPQCGFAILTNRDVGEELQCKSCSVRHRTNPLREQQLSQLLDCIHQNLGLVVSNLAGMLIVLLVQPENPRQLVRIREICKQAGYEELPQLAPVAANLTMDAIERGVIEFGQPLTVCQRYCEDGEVGYSDKTPPTLQSLIYRLQNEIPNFRSLSTSYLPEVLKVLGISNSAATTTDLRRQALEDPHDVTKANALVQFLISQGKYEEASKRAYAATRIAPDNPLCWEGLGLALARLNRLKEAIEASQRSLQLDPQNTGAMLVLVNCYRKLGDEIRAQAIITRLRNLGLPL